MQLMQESSLWCGAVAPVAGVSWLVAFQKGCHPLHCACRLCDTCRDIHGCFCWKAEDSLLQPTYKFSESEQQSAAFQLTSEPRTWSGQADVG